MARNAIESEFRTSKMADRSEMARNAIQSDFRTSKMASEKNQYQSEMARIVIESEFRKSKMADRSEMIRNAIGSEFRTSKMADGSHFVQNLKQIKVTYAYRSEMARMRSKVNFGHPTWPTSAILSKISKKNKVAHRSEMARNAIESDFRTSKMADVSHFVKNFKVN